MDGNKLKHNFIKKKKEDYRRRYAQSHTPYSLWNNIEVQYDSPSITTLQISRTLTIQTTEITENIVKQEMLKEISHILLDNGFIQTIQIDDNVGSTTKLIMKIKAKKI